MDVRPDQEEMEKAIKKFLLMLEKQEKKGFTDLATILSQLPGPAQGSVLSTGHVRGQRGPGRFSSSAR